ncbi:tetratricopeptide repeat protein [Vineibacter terrae]|uniref:Tetratricopeptide repeat protein n=1 Tax=Vineibacter terrae TaxID=2586908 RepID=A0A5C8PH92_9HYPH|nr:tetratricopeptide repeat protein [Vineibacter terrae]TXL72886.1 tetratricopeptide repeat protein [Vineibacter terrae]
MPLGSTAQAQPAPSDRAAYDAAFKAMITDPGDLQKAFAFVELAIKVGDLEGAVAALERMLIIAPNLPRVRLELGVLYYRLGSYQVARRYVTDVLALPDVPPTVRTRAEAFLAEIDRQINPHKFSGSLLWGFRYQSNANAAPTGGTVRFGGIDAQLDRQSTSRKDWNAFIIGTFQHLWDFGTQGGEALDTQGTLYVARQFKATDVNLLYASLSSGPRLWLLPSALPQVSIRPYAAFDYVILGSSTEYVAPGLGVNIDKKWASVSAGFVAELRRRDYHNSATRPFNDFRTGWEKFGRLSADWQVLPWLSLGATAGIGRFDANKPFETYNEWLLGVGLIATMGRPSWAPDDQISLALSAARLWDNYAEPDPTIDPNTTRRDREWRLSATLQIPVAERLAVVVQGARNSRSSTLPNFAYVNYIAMVGMTWRF